MCGAERREEGKGQEKLADVSVCVWERVSARDRKRHNKEHFYKKQSCDSPVHSADCLETLPCFSSPLAYFGTRETFSLA